MPTIDPEQIDVGEGNQLHLLSTGHARAIQAEIDHIQRMADAENRGLNDEEHTEVRAMQDVLLRGAYLLSEGERLDELTINGVVVTQEELDAHASQNAPIEIEETAALRGAAAAGRLLTADEVASYEEAEKRTAVRRPTM